jgi:hypothetical protein
MICNDCKKQFSADTMRSWYCPDCAIKRNYESNRYYIYKKTGAIEKHDK